MDQSQSKPKPNPPKFKRIKCYYIQVPENCSDDYFDKFLHDLVGLRFVTMDSAPGTMYETFKLMTEDAVLNNFCPKIF